MVAIDEASAIRLGSGSTSAPAVIESALSANGNSGKLFTNVNYYDSDLLNLETALGAAHINYQVLSTSVTLRESKWSNAANGL